MNKNTAPNIYDDYSLYYYYNPYYNNEKHNNTLSQSQIQNNYMSNSSNLIENSQYETVALEQSTKTDSSGIYGNILNNSCPPFLKNTNNNFQTQYCDNYSTQQKSHSHSQSLIEDSNSFRNLKENYNGNELQYPNSSNIMINQHVPYQNSFSKQLNNVNEIPGSLYNNYPFQNENYYSMKNQTLLNNVSYQVPKDYLIQKPYLQNPSRSAIISNYDNNIYSQNQNYSLEPNSNIYHQYYSNSNYNSNVNVNPNLNYPSSNINVYNTSDTKNSNTEQDYTYSVYNSKYESKNSVPSQVTRNLF